MKDRLVVGVVPGEKYEVVDAAAIQCRIKDRYESSKIC